MEISAATPRRRDRVAAPLRALRVTASTEQLVIVAAVFWALAANWPLMTAARRAFDAPPSWGFMLALLAIVVALQVLMLGLVATRRSVKPLVALLTLVAAVSLHVVRQFGVVLDPSMLRNTLHTDWPETRELLSWSLALDLLLYAALPIVLLAAVRIRRQPWRRALAHRALLVGGALALLVGALAWQFQPLASLVRNHKALRYLVLPAAPLWSAARVAVVDARGSAQPRAPIGLDAAPGPSWAHATRPRVVVLVVGETARAANWGLSGYARQTTPRLAQLPVVNFADVSACGTSTEVSLPCLFAPVGRRDYDEAKILHSESLLHLLARAGVQVTWRDNQSGCKGVCDGLPSDPVTPANAPGLCGSGAGGARCLDEGLLRGLDERLQHAQGTQVLVLHMLGNHGPAYWRRYPPAFERFVPACRSDDLSRCSRAEIVNAYDNALLYTDHVLASLIATLDAHAARVDSALVFVSDHGESLGEKGLYLHGMPYAIAPREQLQVPMLMWWSDGFGRADGIDRDCLRARAAQPATHDNLFHTVLGLVDVRTALYDASLDLGGACRAP